ncbi:DUF6342 family protein [Streptomyces massasporeus]|uniref:DUF6342 family protein n=1 Tax=Streptomyces massasporeus TaxID=67324 RepID=UPI0034013AB1
MLGEAREVVHERHGPDYFTTHHGSSKKIIAMLDSDGNLHIAGRLITEQKDLHY